MQSLKGLSKMGPGLHLPRRKALKLHTHVYPCYIYSKRIASFCHLFCELFGECLDLGIFRLGRIFPGMEFFWVIFRVLGISPGLEIFQVSFSDLGIFQLDSSGLKILLESS